MKPPTRLCSIFLVEVAREECLKRAAEAEQKAKQLETTDPLAAICWREIAASWRSLAEQRKSG